MLVVGDIKILIRYEKNITTQHYARYFLYGGIWKINCSIHGAPNLNTLYNPILHSVCTFIDFELQQPLKFSHWMITTPAG